MNFKEWLNLIEAEKMRDMFSNDPEKKSLKITFADIKYDPVEGYYADLNKARGNVKSTDEVKVGSKIEDNVFSRAAYWTVNGVDKSKNVIYLTPIKPNPFTPNASGEVVGAGGKVFNQHDFDVMGGQYERGRIDQELEKIEQGDIHDPHEITYLLLGTVPVQVGPNGSQGGWYNAVDRNNRGGLRGMDSVEVMKADAKTLKEKFGMSVPQAALDGRMNPYNWTRFVDGGDITPRRSTSKEEAEHMKLDEEDYENIDSLVKHILSHKQPAIRVRNAEILLDKFYEDPSLEQVVRNVSFHLAKEPMYGKSMDKLWLLKEKFINTAARNHWYDVLKAFENSPDETNRRYVAMGYRGLGKIKDMVDMLVKETHPFALKNILEELLSDTMPYDSNLRHVFSFLPKDKTERKEFFERIKNKYPEEFAEVYKKLKIVYDVVKPNEDKMKSILDGNEEGNNLINRFIGIGDILYQQ